MLLLAVVFDSNAKEPTAVLAIPDVFDVKALLPSPVLSEAAVWLA